MHVIFLLCLFAIFGMQVQGAIPAPFAGITVLKNTVKTINNDLTRYNNNLEFNLKTKLSNLKINQMQNINNAVYSALSDTRIAISKAQEEGRNATLCLEPTILQLRDASNLAFNELDKCVSIQLAKLQPVKQNIQQHIQNGNLLLSSLDSIAISCSSGSAMQVQMCVAQKMPAANNSVRNFEATAKQLKSTGDSISSDGEIGSISCFQSPMSNLYSDVAAARISATNCIKNAT